MRENKVFAATELVKKLNEAENLIKAGSRKQNSNQLQNKNVGDIQNYRPSSLTFLYLNNCRYSKFNDLGPIGVLNPTPKSKTDGIKFFR